MPSSSENSEPGTQAGSDDTSDALSDVSKNDDMFCVMCREAPPYETLEDEDAQIGACVMEELIPFPLLPSHASLDAAGQHMVDNGA